MTMSLQHENNRVVCVLMPGCACQEEACLDGGIIRACGKLEVRGAEGNAPYGLLMCWLCLHTIAHIATEVSKC